MRCHQCGRTISNAELWQLAGNRDAPSSTTVWMQCWSCRVAAAKPLASSPDHAAVNQANAIILASRLRARQQLELDGEGA